MLIALEPFKKEGENEKIFSKTLVKEKTNRKERRKRIKINSLTIDEQISCLAEIICNQLLKEMNLYEKD